jgi:hypothetical protein
MRTTKIEFILLAAYRYNLLKKGERMIPGKANECRTCKLGNYGACVYIELEIKAPVSEEDRCLSCMPSSSHQEQKSRRANDKLRLIASNA